METSMKVQNCMDVCGVLDFVLCKVWKEHLTSMPVSTSVI